jgi:hypothetical protein
MRTHWFGVALLALAATSRADEAVRDPSSPNDAATRESRENAEDPFPEPEAEAATEQTAPPSGVTPSCRPVDQLGTVASQLLDLADANRDDRVTKAEAHALATHLLNDYFFRADSNRNGTLTANEARQSRIMLMAHQPALATVVRQYRGAQAKRAFTSVARLLDIEYGRPIPITEARSAVRAAVDEVFKLADANKDGALDASEVSAASTRATAALSRTVFQTADTNRDQGLSVDELKNSIDVPLRTAFLVADADNDGKLDALEAAVAVEELSRRLVFPASTPAIEVVEKTRP